MPDHDQAFILDRVEEDENGCWLYQGYVNQATGYAQIGKEYVHRMAYELWIGPIPDGAHLDHAKGCPKHCVNPYTMTPVSPATNRALVWRRRTGQMPRRALRVARFIHKQVGRSA